MFQSQQMWQDVTRMCRYDKSRKISILTDQCNVDLPLDNQFVDIIKHSKINVTKRKNWKDVHNNQKRRFVSYLDQKPTSSDQ